MLMGKWEELGQKRGCVRIEERRTGKLKEFENEQNQGGKAEKGDINTMPDKNEKGRKIKNEKEMGT